MSPAILAPRQKQQGFTLIEVIITLVMVAILATILASALGSSFLSSSQPISRLQKTMGLHQVFENIRTDFSAINDIALLKTTIGDVGTQTTGYGAYEVVESRYLKFIDEPASTTTPPGKIEADGVVGDGVLKITLRDPEIGMMLTEFFVEW